MKKIKKADFFWLLPIICVLVLPSCLEKEEGCRDVNATNFAADAERDCEDCCTFPDITFEIDHAVGDTFLRYGDTILFEDKIIQILEASFYVNGISLTGNNDPVIVSDQITLTDRAGNTNLVTDDIAIISRDINSFSYEIGTFSGQGDYGELNFQLGLTDIQADTNPSSVPTAHPLAPSNGLFASTTDSSYVFTRLRLVNVANDDTLQYDLTTSLNITLPYEVTINRGFDLDIPIKVDYLKWIEGINFVDSPDITRAIIVGNLPNAFSIEE